MNQLPFEITESMSQILPPEKWLGFPLVIAVSGGPDSVALLRILLEIRDQHGRSDSPLFVAHVNHGIRGEDSDEDEHFTRRLAAEHDLEFVCERIESASQTESEESLRETRYQFLVDIAKNVNARYIATGHTYDDQVETILFRIIRGTGIAGLAGVPPIRVVAQSISIVRPLLFVKRKRIESYLASRGQHYRIDSSNANTRYARNCLRHEILPMIHQRFGPAVDDAIMRLASQSLEYQSFLDQLAANLENAILIKTENRLEMQTGPLQVQPAILVRHLVMRCWQELNWPRQGMTHQWWSKISTSLMQADGGSIVLNLPANIRLTIAAGVAVFSRPAAHETLPDFASNAAGPEA